MGRSTLLIAAVMAFVVVVPASAVAVPGQFDRDFSGDGRVHVGLLGWSAEGMDVALQANGKIVAVGRAAPTEEAERGRPDSRFFLVRTGPRGGLDRTWGGDGKVTTNLTREGDFASAVAIAPGGRIVAAGVVLTRSPAPRFAVIRYRRDGSLDSSFGSGGIATLDPPGDDPYDGEMLEDVAIQADGKIIILGQVNLEQFDTRIIVARFHTDGTLDTSFGDNGVVADAFPGGPQPSRAGALAIQPDGALLVAGGVAEVGDVFGLPDVVDERFAVARYDSTGELDTSYGDGGLATANLTPEHDFVAAMDVGPGGKPTLCGLAGYQEGVDGDILSPYSFGLARLTAQGTIDGSFGGDGRVITRFGPYSGACRDLALDAGGNVVAVGGVEVPENARPRQRSALARYRPSGALDRTFGGDGKVLSPVHDPRDTSAVAIQGPARRIVTVGANWIDGRRGPDRAVLTVARYLGR